MEILMDKSDLKPEVVSLRKQNFNLSRIAEKSKDRHKVLIA